jgi:hypothetical protein
METKTKMKIRELIKTEFELNENYCREISEEYRNNFLKDGSFDLEYSYLFFEINNCESEIEVMAQFITYFNSMYLYLSKKISDEEFESCSLIKDAIEIEKKIIFKHCNSYIDDEMLTAIDYCEQEIKGLYKV